MLSFTCTMDIIALTEVGMGTITGLAESQSVSRKTGSLTSFQAAYSTPASAAYSSFKPSSVARQAKRLVLAWDRKVGMSRTPMPMIMRVQAKVRPLSSEKTFFSMNYFFRAEVESTTKERPPLLPDHQRKSNPILHSLRPQNGPTGAHL